MKILMLGPGGTLAERLASADDEVVSTEAPIKGLPEIPSGTDFIVSYGYRHILRGDVLRKFRRRAVNLHISYLPWNRGASPNLWSFLEDTPKGVSVHYLGEGIDTGDILARREVRHMEHDTLRTSYERLKMAVEELFIELWPGIRQGSIRPRKQSGNGTCHRLRDQDPYAHLLTSGWDTPVAGLIGAALNKKPGVR